jgi:hypothetical protein
MAILQKGIHKLNILFIKIPKKFFAEIEKKILKFIWKCKEPQRTKAILSKKKCWLYHNTGVQTTTESK